MIVRGVFCHLSFLLILLRLTPGHALTCYDCRGSVSSSHTFTCILIRFLRAADLDETFSNWLHLPQFCIGDHCFLKTINWAKSESAQIQIILHILHCIALHWNVWPHFYAGTWILAKVKIFSPSFAAELLPDLNWNYAKHDKPYFSELRSLASCYVQIFEQTNKLIVVSSLKRFAQSGENLFCGF